jgi:hypothetical protein
MATLVAGIALRDCAAIAAAGPLALCTFYFGMAANAPMDAFRVAIRTALAGIASLFAAAAIAVMALAATHGIWQPAHDWQSAGVWLLAASIAAFALSFHEEDIAARLGPPWLIASAILAAGTAAAILAPGFQLSLCALPLATSVLMALMGWRLLREVAPGILQSGLER